MSITGSLFPPCSNHKPPKWGVFLCPRCGWLVGAVANQARPASEGEKKEEKP